MGNSIAGKEELKRIEEGGKKEILGTSEELEGRTIFISLINLHVNSRSMSVYLQT